MLQLLILYNVCARIVFHIKFLFLQLHGDKLMPTDPLCHEKCMNLFLILHLNVLLYGEEFFKDPNMEFNTATFETMEHAWDGIGAWKSVQWQKSFFF